MKRKEHVRRVTQTRERRALRAQQNQLDIPCPAALNVVILMTNLF